MTSGILRQILSLGPNTLQLLIDALPDTPGGKVRVPAVPEKKQLRRWQPRELKKQMPPGEQEVNHRQVPPANMPGKHEADYLAYYLSYDEFMCISYPSCKSCFIVCMCQDLWVTTMIQWWTDLATHQDQRACNSTATPQPPSKKLLNSCPSKTAIPDMSLTWQIPIGHIKLLLIPFVLL